MAQEPAEYRHDLGNGLHLDVFSLDPNIDENGLVKTVISMDGKANPNSYSSATDMVLKEHIKHLSELKIEVSDKKYSVPEPLKAYREAIGKKWDSEGKFNGPVMIVEGEVRLPLRVMQGSYYDFAATRLTEQPAKLLPEIYEAGKTVEDILRENGISLEQRARYFALSHLMRPSEGREFLLVQRAKGMGIARDCVSTSGSTPDVYLNKPGLKKPGFGIEFWWSHHFAEEMQEEFKLKWGDFWVNDMYIFDDKKSIPHGAVQITTPMSTKEIAQGAYGDAKVLKEHCILYSMAPEAVNLFLERFPVFPAVYMGLKKVLEN